ncbi:MAG: PEP-CTERM sorting domain-containing protein [Bradyrhizobium sp.]
MPSWPPPATTSAASSGGWSFCCPKSSSSSRVDFSLSQTEITVLHGRLGSPGWTNLARNGGEKNLDPRATLLPASWTMMLIGLGLLGIFTCYRKLCATEPIRTPRQVELEYGC